VCGLFGETQQQRHCLVSDPILRIVQKYSGALGYHPFAAFGVVGEVPPKVTRSDCLAVLL